MSSSPSPSAPRRPQQQPSPSSSPSSRRWQQPGQPQSQPPQRPERGIPDGLIVGLLAALLGTTALVWGSTALGGLVSHGRFPHPLPFLSTAGAIRHLATDPNDLPGAWPGTPTASLPSAPAFWFTFFALLALVLLLLLSAATARAKRRAAHDAREREQAEAGAVSVPGAAPGAAAGIGADAGAAGMGGAAAAFGPPGQRRGPTPADHQTSVPTGRTPPGPTAPGPGVAASGVPGAGVPGAGVPGAPGGASPSGWSGGQGLQGSAGGGLSGAVPPAQPYGTTDGGAAPSPWGAGPLGAPGDLPPTGHRPEPQWLDAAPAGSAALGTAPTWATAAGLGTATGPAADGRVVPQAAGSRAPSVPSPSGLGDALPTEGVATAPSGVNVPRPGGSTAAGWSQRAAAAADHQAPQVFALPETGTMCVFAPEAGVAGRRALMSAAVAEAASAPLVVVTADAELWDGRPPHRRAARFDPQQLTDDDPDAPRGRWAPHSACTEPVIATARARALLLPTVRPVAGAEEQSVRRLAETLLRCWLRAAALDGRPFRHVARWAGGSTGGGSGAGRQEAVAVLQSAATPVDAAAGEEAWAGQLQAALLQPAPALDAALGRVRAALGAVAELHVLAACTPESPATALDPAALLEDGAAGSLYLLGRAGDGRLREPDNGNAAAVHSAMPLLSALVDDVVQRAWNTAGKAHNAMTAPAPVFVLDDIAAVAPFPTLPQLMTDGATHGLRAVTLLRSPEQARARWGERAVHSLWTNADHCAVLGPLSPAPLAALLASLGAAEHSAQQALGPDELLVLAGRQRTAPPQRFRIGQTRG
ncbi:TraM recognition domain-containing protein [Streptacidiphilus melanogenes]|uniref:TraM recognition domain-containing protein n=1 Tax=Streptacidiphilus melanogenes TaxID=411235 RepID=UPI000694EC84|nr:TraM recognition domain-containing protein [Streptacidiphilus melanogenes]